MLIFDPQNARQRWEVKTVVVSTNQAATATVVPVATVAKNTTAVSTLSQGNNLGQSWSGNQDIFAGRWISGRLISCRCCSAPPPGQSGGPLSGVIAYATVTGTRYTRRA